MGLRDAHERHRARDGEVPLSSRYQPQGYGDLVPGYGIEIVELLESRDGQLTLVELSDGSTRRVFNIAYGRDAGSDWEHVSTNISPDVPGEAFDFFVTSEVRLVLDPVSRAHLFPSTK